MPFLDQSQGCTINRILITITILASHDQICVIERYLKCVIPFIEQFLQSHNSINHCLITCLHEPIRAVPCLHRAAQFLDVDSHRGQSNVRKIPQQVAVGHHKPVTMFTSLPVNATFCPVCVVFQTTAVTSASLCLLAHSFSSRLLDVPLLESYSEIQTHYTVQQSAFQPCLIQLLLWLTVG